MSCCLGPGGGSSSSVGLRDRPASVPVHTDPDRATRWTGQSWIPSSGPSLVGTLTSEGSSVGVSLHRPSFCPTSAQRGPAVHCAPFQTPGLTSRANRRGADTAVHAVDTRCAAAAEGASRPHGHGAWSRP
ncbi:hypothetical protein HJG60_012148 [Phyllostomus discolor]|uniref:Uncharacterized protein n=1 Tax=Phyllostomus discolor TaxID=89673 RepID=A0A834DWG0_9CHIR|nr:hypothetical protein HJG60_012148 [Phyllostomus discolor]